jgi:hypothetical protein
MKDDIELESITAYKTSDGKLFEYPTDALKHEVKLDFDKNLEKLIDDYISEMPFFSEKSVMIEFINKNIEELKNMFKRL